MLLIKIFSLMFLMISNCKGQIQRDKQEIKAQSRSNDLSYGGPFFGGFGSSSYGQSNLYSSLASSSYNQGFNSYGSYGGYGGYGGYLGYNTYPGFGGYGGAGGYGGYGGHNLGYYGYNNGYAGYNSGYNGYNSGYGSYSGYPGYAGIYG